MHQPKRPVEIEAARANRLLAALPLNEAEGLRPHLETLPMPLRLSLYRSGEPIEYVWFPQWGVTSLVKIMHDGTTVEVATVGAEGAIGIPVFLGSDRTNTDAFVQVAGQGMRIETEAFRTVLARSPALQNLLQRYTLALLNQISHGAACNRAHSVDERCARWLLTTHDRMHRESFYLTQEFLAEMLGVHRPTVTVAAGILQKAGLISYVRGRVTIHNRKGLEAAACQCYRDVSDEFERLTGSKG